MSESRIVAYIESGSRIVGFLQPPDHPPAATRYRFTPKFLYQNFYWWTWLQHKIPTNPIKNPTKKYSTLYKNHMWEPEGREFREFFNKAWEEWMESERWEVANYRRDPPWATTCGCQKCLPLSGNPHKCIWDSIPLS